MKRVNGLESAIYGRFRIAFASWLGLVEQMQSSGTDNTAGALVLFSGGQDSAVCLGLALDRYARVETVGFDYGQRHDVEMQARETVLKEIRRNFPQWSA